ARVEPKEHRRLDALAGLERQFQVLEHGELLEHRGLLELAADAHLGDLRLGVAQQVDRAAEKYRAFVGPRLAGDDVHHRRLARAVGTDDAAQFARRDVQRQLVDGLEAIEADAHVFQVQDAPMRDVHLARRGQPAETGLAPARLCPATQHALAVGLGAARAFFHQVGRHGRPPLSRLAHAAMPPVLRSRPITPSGRNSVTPMNSAPRKYSQISGAATVSQLLAPLTRKAPTIGPASVARPPTAAQIAISIELAGLISLGLMMPTW